ncbi:MAG: hypothetical protein AB1679_23430 [Actinomycetota bacterium]
MALTADEEQAFAQLAAALTAGSTQTPPERRRPAGWLFVVIALICVLAAACLTASIWL